MLIRITGRAEVTLDGGGPVTARSIIRELDGTESDDACANYLDSDLADLGITGGTIKLIYDSDAGGFRVSCAYTAPAKLKPAQLKKLARVTVGQWSDGLGGSCFDALADRLFLAALSNAINDADAARVALALLNGGASAYGTWGPAARPLHGEYTPLYMAKNRKKTKLAAVLKKFGATK